MQRTMPTSRDIQREPSGSPLGTPAAIEISNWPRCSAGGEVHHDAAQRLRFDREHDDLGVFDRAGIRLGCRDAERGHIRSLVRVGVRRNHRGRIRSMAQQSADEALRHVSRADESDFVSHVAQAPREPNSAVPILIIVAPSAIAASKSRVMPIDNVSQ